MAADLELLHAGRVRNSEHRVDVRGLAKAFCCCGWHQDFPTRREAWDAAADHRMQSLGYEKAK